MSGSRGEYEQAFVAYSLSLETLTCIGLANEYFTIEKYFRHDCVQFGNLNFVWVLGEELS